MLPRLALVPGEPAGIGPELCVRLAQQPRTDCTLLAFADPATLISAAATLGLPLQLIHEDAVAKLPGDLRVRSVPNASPTTFGHTDPRNAHAVIEALTQAAGACLTGELDGLVTGPVHKAAINAGGIAYTGTTELLAEHAGRPVVMMLANEIVRVALVTTHLPLREVPDAITATTLEEALRITTRRCGRISVFPIPSSRSSDSTRTRAKPVTWGGRRSTSSNRCCTRCGPLEWTWSARCPPIPPSCRRSCAVSMRWWRCITTRACRCSSTAGSSRP